MIPSYDEAQVLKRKFLETFPEMHHWFRDTKDQAMKDNEERGLRLAKLEVEFDDLKSRIDQMESKYKIPVIEDGEAKIEGPQDFNPFEAVDAVSSSFDAPIRARLFGTPPGISQETLEREADKYLKVTLRDDGGPPLRNLYEPKFTARFSLGRAIDPIEPGMFVGRISSVEPAQYDPAIPGSERTVGVVVTEEMRLRSELEASQAGNAALMGLLESAKKKAAAANKALEEKQIEANMRLQRHCLTVEGRVDYWRSKYLKKHADLTSIHEAIRKTLEKLLGVIPE